MICRCCPVFATPEFQNFTLKNETATHIVKQVELNYKYKASVSLNMHLELGNVMQLNCFKNSKQILYP